MIKQSTASGDAQDSTLSGSDFWNRPPAMRYMGWVLLFCTTLLLLGGAYRAQSNMITSGLLFLALGVLFAPDTLQKGWPIRLGLAVLAVIGAVYTFLV